MAATRKDWEDLNITRDEVKNITEALKNDEFRKLLVEYVEETQNPENIKKYQDDIIQLEAERGIDCTFVNPTPAFVVKTSIDGVKKAFINICSNNLIGKPVAKPMMVENNRGLNWSIPYSLSPGRDDYDKKHNACIVYDVIFHPDTLHLSKNNNQFNKLMIETAFKGLEDAYSITFDKRNFKLPKLKYKGIPYSTVIRKKSRNIPNNFDNNIKFLEDLKCPSTALTEPKKQQVIMSNTKNCDPVYTLPRYVIKYRNDLDMQDFTEDPDAKMFAAIPKELIIEINLPLLNSTKTVKLDILEKALELQCDDPVKYKLSIILPYEVSKDLGSAKFDVDKRILVVALPVIRRKVDIIREDSGVESDIGDVVSKEDESSVNKAEDSPKKAADDFLNADQHYVFPPYDYNREMNSICFILNVKNVDPESIKKKNLDQNGFLLKFSSVGSGFFPINYSFCAKFSSTYSEDIVVEAWDNNVTVQVHLTVLNGEDVLYVGPDDNHLEMKYVDNIIDLTKDLNELKVINVEDEEKVNPVTVISADTNVVVLEIDFENSMEDDDADIFSCEDGPQDSHENLRKTHTKYRTCSEGSGDELPGAFRKSILKNRMNRSLSESCADDVLTHFTSGVLYTWSDSCIPEQETTKDIKKTVRFSQHIQQQTFRANSSILGQRRKNQKKMRNKRRAQERRLSESENSEEGDERSKWIKQKATTTKTRTTSDSDSGGNADVYGNGQKKKQRPKKTEFHGSLKKHLET